MSKSLIQEAKTVIKTLRSDHMNREADVVSSMLADIESEHYRSTKPSDLKKGDTVVMHTCMEATNPKYLGRIWVCKTDAFRHKGHDYDCIFLEGFSGSFSAEYLQKVDIHQLVMAKEENTVIKEALENLRSNCGDQEVIDFIESTLYTISLIGKLTPGDKVKVKLTGLEGILIDIQYEHDRYQLKDTSGWMYGISDLQLLKGDVG